MSDNVDQEETIQDIAIKLVKEQTKNDETSGNGPKERTIFVLGSKGVVSMNSAE
jgi:dynein light intermediate chain 2, cytosolic